MIEEVRREILAAFAHLKMPPPADLTGPSRGDAPGEERIRQALDNYWLGAIKEE